MKWHDIGLVTGSVLTYHFNYRKRRKEDSLYLCLEIPSVNLPRSRSNLVPEETSEQIPAEIRNKIKQMTQEHLTNPQMDKLEVIDFEWELIKNNASREYDNAPIEEILRFASKGTEIALKILCDNKTRKGTWKSDKKIIDSINKKIQENLSSDREQKWGLHFACNSTFLVGGVERIIRKILAKQIDGMGQGILNFLYEIERTGNLGEAWRNFLKEYRQYLIESH